MSKINPISSQHPVRAFTDSKDVGAVSKSEATAAKINGLDKSVLVVKTGLGGRAVSLLQESDDLCRQIKGDWNLLDTEELAEKIIELKNKVTLLEKENPLDPAVEKIKKQAEHLHFRFVHPLALELDVPEKAMPMQFAREIARVSKRIFKTQSMVEFHHLSNTQKREIMRYAGGQR